MSGSFFAVICPVSVLVIIIQAPINDIKAFSSAAKNFVARLDKSQWDDRTRKVRDTQSREVGQVWRCLASAIVPPSDRTLKDFVIKQVAHHIRWRRTVQKALRVYILVDT